VGEYKEDGLSYIDRCLEWCKKYNLGLVLDMHHAPGYRFQDFKTSTLFEDPNQQKRFVDIWRFLAKRYINEREHIAFELLNEVVEPDSTRWNKLMLECVKAIREIDSPGGFTLGAITITVLMSLKTLQILMMIT